MGRTQTKVYRAHGSKKSRFPLTKKNIHSYRVFAKLFVLSNAAGACPLMVVVFVDKKLSSESVSFKSNT